MRFDFTSLPCATNLQAASELATFVVRFVRSTATAKVLLAVDAEATAVDKAAAFLFDRFVERERHCQILETRGMMHERYELFSTQLT